jgi:very-short-patch-repair endonuclease
MTYAPRISAKRRPGDAVTSMPTDKWTLSTRDNLLRKNNKAEMHIRRVLAKCEVTYHRERPIDVAGKKYFIDFMVISWKGSRKRIRVAIEIDGGYHFTPEQQMKDKLKDADLMKCQRVWSVLRISSELALQMTPERLAYELGAIKSGEVIRLY